MREEKTIDLRAQFISLRLARPELGSKPSLTRWRSSRGAKVGIFHGSFKSFTGGCGRGRRGYI